MGEDGADWWYYFGGSIPSDFNFNHFFDYQDGDFLKARRNIHDEIGGCG